MAPPKRKYSYNPDPRLSANQLAEYLTASPTRRKSIVQAAKFPKTSIVARYDRARSGISRYLADAARLARTLTDAVDALKEREARATATEWTKEDCRASIEALEIFMRSQNALGLSKLKCRAVASNQPPLDVSGVVISVALDATTHRVDKDGKDRVGGIILLFSKSEASSRAREERCKLSAVLAAVFAERFLKAYGEAEPKLCMALDVFGKRIHVAPGSALRRLDNVRLACEEVALRWPTIEPPADYDGPPWKKP